MNFDDLYSALQNKLQQRVSKVMVPPQHDKLGAAMQTPAGAAAALACPPSFPVEPKKKHTVEPSGTGVTSTAAALPNKLPPPESNNPLYFQLLKKNSSKPVAPSDPKMDKSVQDILTTTYQVSADILHATSSSDPPAPPTATSTPTPQPLVGIVESVTSSSKTSSTAAAAASLNTEKHTSDHPHIVAKRKNYASRAFLENAISECKENQEQLHKDIQQLRDKLNFLVKLCEYLCELLNVSNDELLAIRKNAITTATPGAI